MKRKVLTAAVLLSALAPGIGTADDDHCRVPMAQWQPREAVDEMAKARGWTVGRIKIDDGCYEIKGWDQNRRSIEVKVDPGSLAVIKVEHDDDHYDALRGTRSEPAPLSAPTSPPNTEATPPKVEEIR
jgi:hypothetical protein